MRGSSYSHNLQDSKQNTQTRLYPVSARAYKKKDYDYLSTFPRMANPVALRASTQHEDVELSHEQSDIESDVFTTTSSINEATSVSSASSTTSSNQSFTKYGSSPLTDMESNPQHQSHSHHGPPRRHHRQHHHRQHQEGHHQKVKATNDLSALNTMENTDLQEVDEENSGSGLKAGSKDSKSDLSTSLGENDSVEVKEGQVELRAKVRSRHVNEPAVLPKFGSWDTKNPSSGEAYTLIFRRLRDEKKSGAGVPVCRSPTHPMAEEPDESPIPESKAKEPLCPKPRTGKDPSRRKLKPTSHHDAAHSRMRWILCCKTSVADD